MYTVKKFCVCKETMKNNRIYDKYTVQVYKIITYLFSHWYILSSIF